MLILTMYWANIKRICYAPGCRREQIVLVVRRDGFDRDRWPARNRVREVDAALNVRQGVEKHPKPLAGTAVRALGGRELGQALQEKPRPTVCCHPFVQKSLGRRLRFH